MDTNIITGILLIAVLKAAFKNKKFYYEFITTMSVILK